MHDIVSGKDCDNECYRNVESKLNNVIHSYSIPDNFLDVLDKYKNVPNTTKTVENITADINVLDGLLAKHVDELNRHCSEAENSYKNLT